MAMPTHVSQPLMCQLNSNISSLGSIPYASAHISGLRSSDSLHASLTRSELAARSSQVTPPLLTCIIFSRQPIKGVTHLHGFLQFVPLLRQLLVKDEGIALAEGVLLERSHHIIEARVFGCPETYQRTLKNSTDGHRDGKRVDGYLIGRLTAQLSDRWSRDYVLTVIEYRPTTLTLYACRQLA